MSDARSAFQWYETQRESLGSRFQQDLASTLRKIEESPLTYRKVRRNLRKCNLRNFPYAVLYRVDEYEIVAVAVPDLRRDSRHWQDRM